jgi:hypothetical protein
MAMTMAPSVGDVAPLRSVGGTVGRRCVAWEVVVDWGCGAAAAWRGRLWSIGAVARPLRGQGDWLARARARPTAAVVGR